MKSKTPIIILGAGILVFISLFISWASLNVSVAGFGFGESGSGWDLVGSDESSENLQGILVLIGSIALIICGLAAYFIPRMAAPNTKVSTKIPKIAIISALLILVGTIWFIIYIYTNSDLRSIARYTDVSISLGVGVYICIIAAVVALIAAIKYGSSLASIDDLEILEPVAARSATPSLKTEVNFCPECGGKLVQNAQFCSSCGHDLTAITKGQLIAPVSTEITEPRQMTPDERKETIREIKKLRRKGRRWLAIGILMIVISIGIWIIPIIGVFSIIGIIFGIFCVCMGIIYNTRYNRMKKRLPRKKAV